MRATALVIATTAVLAPAANGQAVLQTAPTSDALAQDPTAIVLEADDPENDSLPRSGGEDLALTRPLLPSGALLVDGTAIEATRATYFFYAVCGEEARDEKRRRDRGSTSTFTGWGLSRSISCAGLGGPALLTPRPIPDPEPGERCVPLVETIPANRLPPGPCRFEVSLECPEGLTETRTVQFDVVSAQDPGQPGESD